MTATAAPAPATDRVSNQRVLVVDDESVNVQLLEDILEDAGLHNCVGETDPMEALAICRDDAVELVLLDLMMPRLDGYGFLEHVQSFDSGARPDVIVVTADTTTEAKRRALSLGPRDFLSKPVNPVEVGLRVRNALEARLLMKRLAGHNAELEERVKERTLELEEALRGEHEVARQLRELDEMKNAFLASTSHKIRTPLTMVLGVAAVLEDRYEQLSEENARELIHRQARAAKRLDALLSDLMDVERLRRGLLLPNRQATSLRALVDDVLTRMEIGEHTQRIHVDLAVDVLELDADQIKRALENLVENALEHTLPEGNVWISSHRAPSGGVVLTVADDGPGVPDRSKDRIFQPFTQVDTSDHDPGLGVGLALVSSFARGHGGTVSVSDRPGGGAVFSILLPTEHHMGAR